MTDSTKPGAGAVVTREHRIATLAAFGFDDVVGTKNAVANWVEDPRRDHGLFSDMLPVMAQAIADAELRGQRFRDAEVAEAKAASAHAERRGQTWALELLEERLLYNLPDVSRPIAIEALRLTREQLGITEALARGGK